MSKLDWKIIESEYLVENRWITLRADKCAMPDGRIIDPYYIIEEKNWVNVVPVTPDGKVVLIRLYRHGLQTTIWEIPGGLIDVDGEAPLDAIRRELREETGYVAESFELLGSGAPNPARYTNTVFYYLARNATYAGDEAWDHEEEFQVVLIPIAEVYEMLLRGEFANTVQQAALFYAMVRLGWLESGN